MNDQDMVKANFLNINPIFFKYQSNLHSAKIYKLHDFKLE